MSAPEEMSRSVILGVGRIRHVKELFHIHRSKDLQEKPMRQTTDTLVPCERLEPKLPLTGDAGVSRPELTAPEVVFINNAVIGPAPITFERADFFSDGVERFLVGHVASGAVEKYDAATESWRDISPLPTTSHPQQVLQALSARLVQDGDQIRWVPGSNSDMREAFMVVGWNEGRPLPEPPNDVPGRQLANLVVELTETEGVFDLEWLAALPSPPKVEPTHFYPVTEINGAVPDGELKPLQNVESLVPPGLIDSFGREVIIHRGIREAGTRVGIHIHEYGGYTLVLSGTITDFVEGKPNSTYNAGQWYYMPANTPMAAANLGTEDAELIDIFLVPPGQPEITIIEPGWDFNDADGVSDGP